MSIDSFCSKLVSSLSNSLCPSEEAERVATREGLLSALARYAPHMAEEEQLQQLLGAAARQEVVEAVRR